MSKERNNKSNYAISDKLFCYTPFGHSIEWIETESYWAWLEADGNTSFHVYTHLWDYTIRREKRRKKYYWYAYKKHLEILYKVYVGQSDRLTSEMLFKQIPLMIDDKINPVK